MAVNWDDLRVFHEAVRSGDYSSAARKLGMDRTTIGRRLARLEEAVNREIWDQTEDGYRPTATGRALLELAETAEAALATIDAGLVRPRSVRLAGTAGLADLLMPRIAPGASTVEIIPALDGLAALRARLADLAIVVSREPPAGLSGTRIGPFAQARYALRGAPVSGQIGWSHAMMLANPRGWARLNEVVDGATCEVSTLGALHAAVLAGLGTAWLWEPPAEADERLVRLEGAPPASASADLWIQHRADMAPSPAVVALRDSIAAALHAAPELSPSASPAAR